jgi:hypothetical protein
MDLEVIAKREFSISPCDSASGVNPVANCHAAHTITGRFNNTGRVHPRGIGQWGLYGVNPCSYIRIDLIDPDGLYPYNGLSWTRSWFRYVLYAHNLRTPKFVNANRLHGNL